MASRVMLESQKMMEKLAIPDSNLQSYIFPCYYNSEMRLNARFIFSKCLYK